MKSLEGIKEVQYKLAILTPKHVKDTILDGYSTSSHVEVRFDSKRKIQLLVDDLMNVFENSFPYKDRLVSKCWPLDKDNSNYYTICDNSSPDSCGLAQVVVSEIDDIARIHLYGNFASFFERKKFLEQYANKLKKNI